MGKPNFFIIGAPQCGSQSLTTWLAGHPDVCFSDPLRLHYFLPHRARKFGGLEDYERCFAHALPQHRAIVDKSPHTIYHPEAVERILDYQPDARFILCLRSPVEMALTYMAPLLNLGHGTVEDFAEIWFSRMPISSCYLGEDMPACDFYRRQCALGSLMQRFATIVPAGRMLPIVLDELLEDPAAELGRVTRFLGISDRGPAAARRFKLVTPAIAERPQLPPAAALRLWSRNLRRATRRRPALLDPVIHEMLTAYFEIEIRTLECLLGRGFSNWRRPPLLVPPEPPAVPGLGWLRSGAHRRPSATPAFRLPTQA